MTVTINKTKINKDFARRRFLEFRNGHGLYLIFAIAFMQFVILTYTLALERVELLKEIFPNMWMWGVAFILFYVPSATLIGYWHRKHQLPNESQINTLASPYLRKAQPGKEQQYSLPAALLNYDLQLKNMRIHNNTADMFLAAFKVQLPKWTDEEIQQVEYFREMTVRLMKGESITEQDHVTQKL